jgi:putative transposase
VAANTEGKREIVGLHIGPSEAETFWATFLKGMARRGLRGVKLVISDAHEGLKAAIRRVVGASWQRCRVHTIRTQLTVRLGEASTPRRWTVQRDDMADLQAALVHDDALDDELQNRLSVGKARLPEAAAHTLAEGGQVAQHRLRFDLLAA